MKICGIQISKSLCLNRISGGPYLCHFSPSHSQVTCCWGRGLWLDGAGAGWWLESLQSRLQPSSPDILRWQTPARITHQLPSPVSRLEASTTSEIYNIVSDLVRRKWGGLGWISPLISKTMLYKLHTRSICRKVVKLRLILLHIMLFWLKIWLWFHHLSTQCEMSQKIEAFS